MGRIRGKGISETAFSQAVFCSISHRFAHTLLYTLKIKSQKENWNLFKNFPPSDETGRFDRNHRDCFPHQPIPLFSTNKTQAEKIADLTRSSQKPPKSHIHFTTCSFESEPPFFWGCMPGIAVFQAAATEGWPTWAQPLRVDNYWASRSSSHDAAARTYKIIKNVPNQLRPLHPVCPRLMTAVPSGLPKRNSG